VVRIKPRRRKGRSKMWDIIIGKGTRYVIMLLVGGFLTKLVEQGLLKQGTLDQWVDATGLVLLAVATFLYTGWIKPWIDKRISK